VRGHKRGAFYWHTGGEGVAGGDDGDVGGRGGDADGRAGLGHGGNRLVVADVVGGHAVEGVGVADGARKRRRGQGGPDRGGRTIVLQRLRHHAGLAAVRIRDLRPPKRAERGQLACQGEGEQRAGELRRRADLGVDHQNPAGGTGAVRDALLESPGLSVPGMP